MVLDVVVVAVVVDPAPTPTPPPDCLAELMMVSMMAVVPGVNGVKGMSCGNRPFGVSIGK